MSRCSASLGCFCCCKLCQHVLGCSGFWRCCGLFRAVSVVSGRLGVFGPPWDVLVVLGCLVSRSDVVRLFYAVSIGFGLFRLIG